MQIGYARVSTSDQTPQLQLDALTVAGCTKIFTDHASGASRSRPGLDDALSHLRSGDALVVWKLDRLGRDVQHLIALVRDLESRGVGFKTLTGAGSIDTTGPSGRLVFTMFAAIAEFERDLIRERTKAGLEAARRMGRVGGRPKALDARGLRQARTLLQDPENTWKDVAARLQIGVATLHRALPGGPTSPRN